MVVAMVTREGIDSRAVSAITQRVGEMDCGALRLIAVWLKRKRYLIKARWDSTKKESVLSKVLKQKAERRQTGREKLIRPKNKNPSGKARASSSGKPTARSLGRAWG